MNENSKISSVKKLIDLAIHNKISRIQMGDIVIDVSPMAFMSQQSIAELKKAMEPELCPCGHSYDDHNELGCLHGCDISACKQPEAKKE